MRVNSFVNGVFFCMYYDLLGQHVYTGDEDGAVVGGVALRAVANNLRRQE
jgi:hypothetical protein